MIKRPLSVTIISWYLIVMQSISMIAAFAMRNLDSMHKELATIPVSEPAYYAKLFSGSLLEVVAAIFMLKGANWARLVYIFGGGINIVAALYMAPNKGLVLPALFFYLLFVFFLTRGKVVEYFQQESHEKQNQTDNGSS